MKSLDGPRHKIRRAERHIKEAQNEIERFLSRKPYRLAVEIDTDPTFQRVVMVQQEPVPYDITLIIGDAIHNLRAALDHLAWELFRSKSLKSREISFPIEKKAKSVHGKIHRFHTVNPAAADVLASLKPYRGGNLALYGLHTIDIIDKHRLLVSIGRIPGQKFFPFFVSSRGTVTIVPTRGMDVEMMRKGYWRIMAVPQLKSGDVFIAEVDIAFGLTRPFGGEAVVTILNELARYILGIIKTCEAHCFRKEIIVPPTPFWPRKRALPLLLT